jgi:hypothetical protein
LAFAQLPLAVSETELLEVSEAELLEVSEAELLFYSKSVLAKPDNASG